MVIPNCGVLMLLPLDVFLFLPQSTAKYQLNSLFLNKLIKFILLFCSKHLSLLIQKLSLSKSLFKWTNSHSTGGPSHSNWSQMYFVIAKV